MAGLVVRSRKDRFHASKRLLHPGVHRTPLFDELASQAVDLSLHIGDATGIRRLVDVGAFECRK